MCPPRLAKGFMENIAGEEEKMDGMMEVDFDRRRRRLGSTWGLGENGGAAGEMLRPILVLLFRLFFCHWETMFVYIYHACP